jgi:type IV pilus assembly protein PilX
MLISLIVLMVMTALAISTMGAATLEEKMAGNANERTIAFQASETGLRTGETWLAGLTQLPTANSTATGGVYSLDNIPAEWWVATPPTVPPPVAAGTIDEASDQPRYVVEQRAFIQGASLVVGGSIPPPGYTIYAIDSRGTGPTEVGAGGGATASVFLQSTFAVPD